MVYTGSAKSKKSRTPSPIIETPAPSPSPISEEIEEEPTDFQLFNVQQPLAYIHISYSIAPKKTDSYEIDIICWKEVSKVFSSDGDKIVKNVIDGKNSWVPVSVTHYFCMRAEDIVKFGDHKIEFTISTAKSKVGERYEHNEN